MQNSWLKDKSVLVTGASGTVGRGLLSAILRENPKSLRALDHHEHGLFEIQQEIGDRENVRWLLGDIRDEKRMSRAMEGVDVVFHAAALKHVSIGEYNPFEIVQTNLLGLQNVIQAAIDHDVERVIFTSSDKAVNPTNAMGASKMMGERLMIAAQSVRRHTRFASVRFGNIIGSNGSVVPIFYNQIKKGNALTLTDKRMTRFVMEINHAVSLVLKAAEIAVGGEVFVLKMPVVRIEDLATTMIGLFGSKETEVQEIGIRRSEKLYEELLMEAEVDHSFENDEMIAFVGEENEATARDKRPYLQGMTAVSEVYDSHNVTPMNNAEITEMLDRCGFPAENIEVKS